jgi:gliding motility-associated-like protein
MSMHRRYIHSLLLCIFLLAGFRGLTQEICTNGIDDDGDGLVDLYDPDCQCHFIVTDNLLQNGSFELYDHCPVNYTYISDSRIATYWQYGSLMNEAEFYHNLNCSYDSLLTMLHMPPALPLPNGSAFISISNSAFITPIPENDMPKGYVGQCLQAPLSAGENYTLSFYAGRFRSWDNFIGNIFPFTVAVFGNADCNAVPFGDLSALGNGCPLNYPGWVLLGKKVITGANEWIQNKISFTPSSQINVIDVGVDCSVLPQIPDLADSTTFLDYHIYYMDDLHLLPTKDFPFQYIHAQAGSGCNGNGLPILESPVFPNATYQWYKDSVAINGATGTTYPLLDIADESYYNVLISTPGKCIITEAFLASSALPKINIPADTLLCDNNDLVLAPALEGITYSINGVTANDVTITRQGSYSITATDNFGCQRTFNVNVVEQKCTDCDLYIPSAFTPNGDGLNDIFKAKSYCFFSEFDLQIFNRWGEKVFESHNNNAGWDGTYLGSKMLSGVYVYFISYSTASHITKTTKGTVALIR